MRVRRETGDFSIKFTATTNPVLPKNLLAEDLLGAVVEAADGTMTIVTAVAAGTGGRSPHSCRRRPGSGTGRAAASAPAPPRIPPPGWPRRRRWSAPGTGRRGRPSPRRCPRRCSPSWRQADPPWR